MTRLEEESQPHTDRLIGVMSLLGAQLRASGHPISSADINDALTGLNALFDSFGGDGNHVSVELVSAVLDASVGKYGNRFVDFRGAAAAVTVALGPNPELVVTSHDQDPTTSRSSPHAHEDEYALPSNNNGRSHADHRPNPQGRQWFSP